MKYILSLILLTLLCIAPYHGHAEEESTVKTSTESSDDKAETAAKEEEEEEEEKEEDQVRAFIYQPDDCEFAIGLPEEPYTIRRCHPNMPEKCDLMTSYTQVFGLSTTLNFYISCKPVTAEVTSQFDESLMRTTLIARAGTNLDIAETAYNAVEEDNIKVAVLMGSSAENGNEKLYVSQIWAGETSIFTIEAELLGEARTDADKMLATILRTIHKKSDTTEDNTE